MPRPTKAIINLSALRHNYQLSKNLLIKQNPTVKAWAVVKADAYGHGLTRCANAIADIADGFALVELDGAIALRGGGIRQPILLLEGFFEASDLNICAQYSLSSVIHNFEQLKMIRMAKLSYKLPVYIKINSGMNRLGFGLEQIPQLIDEINNLEGLGEITLMTHFARADGKLGIDWQIDKFNKIKKLFENINYSSISLANSAAIIRYSNQTNNVGDWIRPGIMLYGSSPLFDSFPKQSANAINLKPVMTLKSKLIAVKNINVGDEVGYGGIFKAEKPTRIGIVACGYADGYIRNSPNGTPILVDGRRTITIGRVSMDMIACDLTNILNAGFDSEVVLWGEGMPIDEVAQASGTISYELLCAINSRVEIIVSSK